MIRKVIAIISVDDSRAIAEDLGTLDFLEKEIGRCKLSGITLDMEKIIDLDDPEDTEAIDLAERIFDCEVDFDA